MGLLAYLLLLWGLVYVYHTYLMRPRAKALRRLKLTRSFLRDRLRWNRDIMPERQIADLESYIIELDRNLLAARGKTLPVTADAPAAAEAVAEDEAAAKVAGGAKPAKAAKATPVPPPVLTDTSLESLVGFETWLNERIGKQRPESGNGLSQVKDVLELMVVVLGVVMGARSLFIQPFKIPTGSMQPTLYGVHFTPTDPSQANPGPVGQLFALVNQGRRYVDVPLANSGQIELDHIKPASGIPSLPNSTVEVDGLKYTLPGEPSEVHKYLTQLNYPYGYMRRSLDDLPYVKEGDALAHGYIEMGDHLFVDRISYNFREPARGDIVVFVTDDIIYQGRGLNGRYYIKRLVGLPGETLKIKDRKLYVQEVGATDFRLVGEADSKAFERMYTLLGGYRGYKNMPHATYLTTPESVYTLAADQYFMMGDNSENSQDSRYWGTVGRDAIVGRACMVWWPFTRRWGPVDRVDPLSEPSTLSD